MADETRSLDTSLALIEEQADASIRRVWFEGRLFFSVIDVVGVLADAPTPRNYWAMVKNRAQSAGFRELLTKCERLKMRSTDGKMRETDAADVETLLRICSRVLVCGHVPSIIIQSIPSPRATCEKQWQA